MIRAEVHSDDYAAAAKFDATAWFEQADDASIEQLSKCGFGGDYAADAVAEWSASLFDSVADVFHYDELARCGFECHVNVNDAEAWIAANRPHLTNAIAYRMPIA